MIYFPNVSFWYIMSGLWLLLNQKVLMLHFEELHFSCAKLRGEKNLTHTHTHTHCGT